MEQRQDREVRHACMYACAAPGWLTYEENLRILGGRVSRLFWTWATAAVAHYGVPLRASAFDPFPSMARRDYRV